MTNAYLMHYPCCVQAFNHHNLPPFSMESLQLHFLTKHGIYIYNQQFVIPIPQLPLNTTPLHAPHTQFRVVCFEQSRNRYDKDYIYARATHHLSKHPHVNNKQFCNTSCICVSVFQFTWMSLTLWRGSLKRVKPREHRKPWLYMIGHHESILFVAMFFCTRWFRFSYKDRVARVAIYVTEYSVSIFDWNGMCFKDEYIYIYYVSLEMCLNGLFRLQNIHL